MKYAEYKVEVFYNLPDAKNFLNKLDKEGKRILKFINGFDENGIEVWFIHYREILEESNIKEEKEVLGERFR